MRLTESQLRRIIREEKLRITPVRRGQLMSEARASYLADEVMQEGLWDSLKAAFKGAAAGAKAVDAKVTGIALDAVKAAAAPIVNAAKAGAKAIGDIKDAAVKAAAEEAAASLKDSLAAEIQKQTATIIQKLVKAGKTEEEAKGEASALVTAALSSAVGSAGQAAG